MRFFTPEIVQTSALDCGPAALKCLLEGFGISVSYGRLREACQTGLDGTSIDTMEAVANELGLEAEQIMLPADHLLLPEAHALPAIVVVTLANGVTHFVVVWRRIGNLLQVMDPAVGRRWIGARSFLAGVYIHKIGVGTADWHEFATASEFQSALAARLGNVGFSKSESTILIEQAAAQGWRRIAALDAAVRLLTSIEAIPRGAGRAALLGKLCQKPELIPRRYWSVVPEEDDEGGHEQVQMAGAVLVRVKGKRAHVAAEGMRPEVAAAIEAPRVNPARELTAALWKNGAGSGVVMLVALLVAAGGTMVEALLFRALLDLNGPLKMAGQRGGAIAAVLLFGLAMLLFEAPIFTTGCRLGRHFENGMRVLFLEKIPKLGDRYFQSRLTSDMAERSHAAHRLRHLPDQARQLLSAVFQLAATAMGILWLDPRSAVFVFPAMAAALLPAFCAQPMLIERDLRARTHSAGLTRFYLDAMLGLLAIRAHGAERVVRQEHEKLLGKWAQAALRLQSMIVSLEAVQLTFSFGLIAALLLTRPHEGVIAGQLLLLAYWALNLPVLGRKVGSLARQYPSYRNLTLRLLEPLGAPEEEPLADARGSVSADGLGPERGLDSNDAAPTICFRNVSAQVSGNAILGEIDLEIATGSHVAVVGPSGAGKSSLVGMLLGWLKPSAGEILIDGDPLDCERLRGRTAWVDPAVQLWNRSLLTNLTYGSRSGVETSGVAEAMDAAMLRTVLESLPEGLQTKLGEAGAMVSGGEGQRVRFARALLRGHAKLVILDEPFRGLDREKRSELLRRARDHWRGATLICVTHDLGETQGFDRVVVIERGRIAEQGDPFELRSLGGSRYAELLAAEEQIRKTLWSSEIWRRVHVSGGQIVEELPLTDNESVPASEVA